MQFNLDTEHCEGLKLRITDKERQDGLAVAIQEFCFGMASFFVDFAMKLNCDAKQAMKLKEVCFSCIDNNIDDMVNKHSLLEPKETEVDEDEINDYITLFINLVDLFKSTVS